MKKTTVEAYSARVCKCICYTCCVQDTHLHVRRGDLNYWCGIKCLAVLFRPRVPFVASNDVGVIRSNINDITVYFFRGKYCEKRNY